MSRRYDQSTTTFSPEGSYYQYLFQAHCIFLGRLHQVEYAIEAINNAGTCLGLLSPDGIILAAERKVVSKLLAPSKTRLITYFIIDLKIVRKLIRLIIMWFAWWQVYYNY